MVNEDVYCIDIIQQIQAVQAALNKVNTLILDNHLRTCVTTAIQGRDPAERERMLQEITSVFEVRRGGCGEKPGYQTGTHPLQNLYRS